MWKEIGLRVGSVLGWLVRALLFVVLAYATAGLIGGSIPANSGWNPPARGVRILVEDNGIHTGLVLPVRAAGQGADWATTSRDEADRNRGREMRRQEARERKQAERDRKACRRAGYEYC